MSTIPGKFFKLPRACACKEFRCLLSEILMTKKYLDTFTSQVQKVDKDEDALWFIEKIIRKRKRKGKTEVFVQFDGWPKEFNRWIPETDVKDVADS